MFTVAICFNYEDVYYDFKETIEFDDLEVAVAWVKDFLLKDKHEYQKFCLDPHDDDLHLLFELNDEEDIGEFYLTLTLVDEDGYAGGYMSENAILEAQLNYTQNGLGELDFYAPWSIYHCEGKEDKYHVYSALKQDNIPAIFYDE